MINHPRGSKIKVIHIIIVVYRLVVQTTPKLRTDLKDKRIRESTYAKVSCPMHLNPLKEGSDNHAGNSFMATHAKWHAVRILNFG